MEKTSPTIPVLLEDEASALEWIQLRSLLEDQGGLDHYLSVIKQYIPNPNDKDYTLPSEVTLLLMIIDEHEEINRLKEKVEWLEQRLLMEISDAPPRFIPP